ncbi:hypothetical protein FOCC_FOCC002478 [Frankliniella occidentalis]|nr:hypothetical protein FOCC_FOCC002478 [Frankliniella occidentalis]
MPPCAISVWSLPGSGYLVGDGSWNLRVFVTDLQVERSLRVKGDLHIGGVMLRLVEDLGPDGSYGTQYLNSCSRRLGFGAAVIDGQLGQLKLLVPCFEVVLAHEGDSVSGDLAEGLREAVGVVCIGWHDM